MELASTNSTHKEAWKLIEGRKMVHIDWNIPRRCAEWGFDIGKQGPNSCQVLEHIVLIPSKAYS